MQTIVKIKKVNYVDEVYHQISEMIQNGIWIEGQKLPSETQLATEFNVSRIVIREALQRLRAERKIITKQGLGSFCANPCNFTQTSTLPGTVITMQEYRQFLEFRTCMEYRAVMLAAKARTEEDLEAMWDAAQRMEEARDDDILYTEKDFFFHYRIICATHNPFLIQAYAVNRDLIIKCLYQLNAVKDSKKFSYDFHRKLYNMIRDQREQDALNVMRVHDEYNQARIMCLLGDSGENA